MPHGTSPRICFYIPASPTDAFYSQVAMLRLALNRLGRLYEGADIVLGLGGEEVLPLPVRWEPFFAGGVKPYWADPDLYRKNGYFAQGSARWKYNYDAYDIVVFCDADTLLVRTIDELWLQMKEAPAVMGVIAHYPFTWNTDYDNEQAWMELARQFLGKSIDLNHQYSLLAADHPSAKCPFYINYGFVTLTPGIIREVRDTYLDFRPRIAALQKKKYRIFAGQMALSLALLKHDIPTYELGLRYNYPNDPRADQIHPAELQDVRLFHYLRTEKFNRHSIFTTKEAFHEFLSLELDGSNKVFQDHIRKLTDGRYPFEFEESARSGKGKQEDMAMDHKRIIVVLGMHRSGTSAITRSLEALGVGLGGNLHPAGFDNPKGFWEDQDCLAINESLLGLLGLTYDRFSLGTNVDINDPLIHPLYLQAVEVVSRNISSSHGMWGLKDPRMCRLLGFWKEVFEACGCNVSYIISLRNPISVADSLNSRNEIPSEKSHFLWLQHMVPAVLETRAAVRVVVDYDLLMESPVEQVQRISQQLQLPVKTSEQLHDFSENFLEKGLRHSHYSLEQTISNTAVPADTLEAYALLFRAARDEISINATEVQHRFEVIERNLRAYSGAFEYASKLETAQTDLYYKIRDGEARLAERNARIVRQNQAIHELNRQLTEIRSSTSWSIALRITRAAAVFFPSGTSRGTLARLFVRGLRTLRNDGLGTAVQRTFLKIQQVIPDRFVRSSPQITKVTHVGENSYVHASEFEVDPEQLLVKAIAFYLPQFHPIPENDAWWGKGFTEWTNVSKAIPNFEGHYQPHVPDETIGYYDLRQPEVQRRQVELAKKYGIHGFCFYYYWFAGKRLLERPIDQYLADPSLDLPFCLCWANENWTRRWDGAEHEILIGQTHNEDEYLHFIRDISPNFKDRRYIRVDGKPMLLVYRINLLPDPQTAARIWRAECKRLGIGDLFLVAVQSFGITDPRPYGFDAAVEFPPSHLGDAEVASHDLKITNRGFKGRIFDYNTAARLMRERQHQDYLAFKAVMPAWDNTARRQNDAHIFINASPSAYQTWLANAVTYSQQSLPEDKRFVFINAWNEWAEGAHLEPDRLQGYAYLQATADAVVRQAPLGHWTILFVSHDANKGGAQQVLINTLEWLKRRTNIQLKVLCLRGGEWLPRFKNLADTFLLDESGLENDPEGLLDRIRGFCGGSPDLIYANSVAAGSAFSWLKKLEIPILTHVHELQMSIEKYGSEWISEVIDSTAHFIACSAPVQRNLMQTYGVPAEKLSVIPSSIQSARSVVLETRHKRSLRKKLRLKQDQVLIFGCGIGMPFRKGADLFIQLGESLLEEGHANFHLYWIGDFDPTLEADPFGKWGDHLAKLDQPELKKHISFLGFKDDVREYLSSGDIFVLPSREDPFPLVALEAADCGLPIVCFEDAGGMPEFVGTDAGSVVPFGDVKSMTKQVIALLADPGLRKAQGNRAREKLLQGFTPEATTPHVLSLCRQIAGQKPAVSVIVPNYNHAPYLAQRLTSIFGQTFRDFEVILLDDASSDNSLEIADKYTAHADFRIVQNEKNSGSTFRQWLRGMDLAKSDVFWVAESDDVADVRLLETLVPAFRDPRVKLAYSNSHIINQDGSIMGDYLSSKYLSSLSVEKWKRNYKVDAGREINDGLGIKNTILNMSAVLVRRFEMDVEFRETIQNMRIAGDWYFIVHAIREGRLVYDTRKLNFHRRHGGSVIAQTVGEMKIREFFREMYLVQQYIIDSYSLSPDFAQAWERYLQDQWNDFTYGEPFEQIERYYPFEQTKREIFRHAGEHHVS